MKSPAWKLAVAIVLVICARCATSAAPTDAPNLILRNGVVLTMDPDKPRAEALAISANRIVALGSNQEVDALRKQDTTVFDLAGRTVIPGLIDTHIHAIRGGQTFRFETYWYDAKTLDEALGALRSAAGTRDSNQWVAVVGSWHPNQFGEKRPPTVAELANAVPDHPVYIQYLYDYALLNRKGIAVLRLDEPGVELVPGITVERDAKGRATGKLFGSIGPFNVLFSRITPSDSERQKASLEAFLFRLNGVGVTGFIDPAAGPPANYEPLFALRDEGKLTIRAGYRIPAQRPGNEAEWFSGIMAFRPPRHSDGMLSFLGLGEPLVFGMYDGVQMGPGFNPPQAARDELLKVTTFAAQRRIPLEMHAYTDDAAKAILDTFEAVAKSHPLKGLRWSIAHLNTGSAETLDRMKKLGIAYTVQMGPFFEAPAIRDANGLKIAEASPPTRLALDKGLMVAGGTDATRIGVYGVWQAIEYHVIGRSLGGAVQRRTDYLLSREEALKLYTANAAWIAFDEHDRGTLSVGKLADLAVLDKPYMTMPADQIHTIRSVLTLFGGKVVHDTGALVRQ
jgi:predicted amidohydrolase YtcJ